jgi:hypothetical protein
MIQILPMIAGLLQDKQKQAEQSKQAEMAAYMGQAPPQAHSGDSKGGLLNGAMGLLQGIGGEDKGAIQSVVADKYKGDATGTGPSSGPTHDAHSTEANFGSLSVPSYFGASDYDEDDQL